MKILSNLFLNIAIQDSLRQLFPSLTLGCLQASVVVKPSDEVQKNDMLQICDDLAKVLTCELIRALPVVEITKNAYRKMGKDPNRYRPSAESLLRRVASGKGLYFVNNVVDVLNMVSVQTGFSICGYDADKIDGDISFGTGVENELYEGIGRGILNIENMFVFRDNKGAFGTPTSDSTRTMVTESTKRFLMIFPSFGTDAELDKALQLSSQYLEKYSDATNIIINIYP